MNALAGWQGIRPATIGVLLALAVAACAPVLKPPPAPETAAEFPAQAAEAVFAAAFRNITEKYIEKVALDGIVLEGLRGLGSIDASLTVDSGALGISLFAGGRRVASYPLPEAGDVDGWAALTTKVSAAGRSASPELGRASMERLYESVIDGALSNLDVFSRYAGAEEARKNRAKRDGYGGVGLRLSTKDPGLVTGVMPETPASRADIESGDRITHIDGVSSQGMETSDLADRLRGPVKSKVRVTVTREGGEEPLTFEMVRARIVPGTVVVRHDKGIVLITVSSFNQGTTDGIASKLREAVRTLGADMKGVVLDLRGNPGGLLKQSVEVADLFLAEGDIVSTKGRHPDSIQHYEAGGSDLAHGLPLVVLVDGRSASSSEIVAAALQDRGRAVVVGTTSFGKGTVQQVIRLPNDGEITLTWSRFVTPSGYALNGLGVRPSICTSGLIGDDQGVIDRTLDGRREVTSTHAAWRRVAVDDEAARKDLRASCPAERRRDATDAMIARQLIDDRVLYGRVIDLLTATATALHGGAEAPSGP